MNNAISTNDDLLQFADDLVRLQLQQTLRVLVMVADYPLRKLFQGFFQQRKVRNLQAFEKGTALIQTMLASKDKTVVFYDLETPDKNGLELLALLKKVPDACKNIQVVLVTGQVQNSISEKLLAGGASAILARPISQDSMVECLKTLKLSL